MSTKSKKASVTVLFVKDLVVWGTNATTECMSFDEVLYFMLVS